MKKRKLKGFVLPTIYVVIVLVTFISISLFNNLLIKDLPNFDYSKSLMKDVTQSVLSETESKSFNKPYESQNVTIKTGYYSKDDDEEKQQKGLILYENTYMPSTGIIYASNEEFDVMSIYDGIVKSVKEDNILGTVVEIEHNPNLTTFYYSLKDVKLQANDEIRSGTIIGKATSNKIYTNENVLLFEVYYQGKSLDPEMFYLMKPNEMQ